MEPMTERQIPTQPGPGQAVSPEQQSYEEAMMEKRLAAQQRNRRKARQSLKEEQMKFAEEDAVQKAVQDRQSNDARQQELDAQAKSLSFT
tara:strand:- start:3345 stop:3614 length:270 start_codon:yes stop_codon:yes gene_type:complete